MSDDIRTCQIHKKYGEIECDNPAIPGDPDGFCILHSRNVEKDREGVFKKAIQEKLKKQDYDFKGIFFPEKMNFKGHEFKKWTDFGDATFNGVDFSEAIFSNVTFLSAI